jgi:hypothetical protein
MKRWNAIVVVMACLGLTSTYSFAVDTDKDGLPDEWEGAHGLDSASAEGRDGAQGDTDGDKVTNINEFRSGTDPSKRDSDGDGIDDYYEDPDGDWLPTGSEQDIYGTNPGDSDSDDDGLNDGPEIQKRMDPTKADSDGDGVGDAEEAEETSGPAP